MNNNRFETIAQIQTKQELKASILNQLIKRHVLIRDRHTCDSNCMFHVFVWKFNKELINRQIKNQEEEEEIDIFTSLNLPKLRLIRAKLTRELAELNKLDQFSLRPFVHAFENAKPVFLKKNYDLSCFVMDSHYYHDELFTNCDFDTYEPANIHGYEDLNFAECARKNGILLNKFLRNETTKEEGMIKIVYENGQTVSSLDIIEKELLTFFPIDLIRFSIFNLM